MLEDEKSSMLVNGQKHVIDRLLASNKNNRIGHAYMFDGVRGTGKEATAMFFARLLLCENTTDAGP